MFENNIRGMHSPSIVAIKCQVVRHHQTVMESTQPDLFAKLKEQGGTRDKERRDARND